MTKIKDITDKAGKTIAEFYDRCVMDSLSAGTSLFYTGKFRKQRVPKYFKIRIPVIEQHICCGSDYDYDDYSESGWLITTKEVKLFKIGTEVIEVPIMRKFKGKTVKFRRYSKGRK